MKEYKNIHSVTEPAAVEITDNLILVAKNIHPYSAVMEEQEVQGYEYDCTEYTKDEYLMKLARENAQLKQDILDTQLALVELYEAGGDL